MEEQEEEVKTRTVTDCPFSSMSLLEILCVSLFETLPEGAEEDCNVDEIRKKIYEYALNGLEFDWSILDCDWRAAAGPSPLVFKRKVAKDFELVGRRSNDVTT